MENNNKEGRLTLNSREVAVMLNKTHAELLREVDGRKDGKGVGIIPTLLKGNFPLSDYFNESSYKDESGKSNKCYLVTKAGCEILGNKQQGEKGILFTAKYVERFNNMENALKGVYHISETAIVNNVMNIIEGKLFTSMDERLSKYEENYRPTHANKISINNYIKNGLGEFRESEEVDLVKQRVLLMLNGQAWQDIPYEKLIKNMSLIDESIRAVKSFRVKKQLSLFEY